MIRVYVICEGPTEERFIQTVLAPELAIVNIFLSPTIIGKPGHQGGNVTYSRMLRDIQVLLNDKAYF